jgi:hypothetical protein
MIKGESSEDEIFEQEIKQLKNQVGATIEIGGRRGMGSKLTIDSFRKQHPNVKLNHLGIDPYGNIEYNEMEAHKKITLDYTKEMKRDAVLDFTKDYQEFNLVYLENTEFFKRYSNGYPMYEQYKTMITQYNLVHFNRPQEMESVLNEINFSHLVKSLASSCVKLYEGHKVLELAACGLKLEACCSTLEACRLHLEQLGA